MKWLHYSEEKAAKDSKGWVAAAFGFTDVNVRAWLHNAKEVSAAKEEAKNTAAVQKAERRAEEGKEIAVKERALRLQTAEKLQVLETQARALVQGKTAAEKGQAAALEAAVEWQVRLHGMPSSSELYSLCVCVCIELGPVQGHKTQGRDSAQ